MRFKLSRAALPALLAGSASAAFAQGAKIDPKVDAVFKETVAAYKALTVLHEKVSMKVNTASPEIKKSMSGPEKVELRIQKPNRIYLDFTGTNSGRPVKTLLVCDGTSVWRWSGDSNTYTKIKAPATLAGIPGVSNDLPELDIIVRGKNPFNDMSGPGGAMAFKVGEPMKVGDVDVDVLEASPGGDSAPFKMQIRMLVGRKDRLFHGLSVEGGGKNPVDQKDFSFDAKMNYDLVDAAPTFTAADFTFTPPPGAKLKATPAPAAKPSTPSKSTGAKKPSGG